MEGRLQIFSGNANLSLAQEIAGYLNINLGRAIVSRFKNGELRIKLEENVRGSDVFVIQPTCTPVNEHLMELLLLIDALRRASAARVTAVIPYYGYAKQEKKTTGREPISAKLVANLIRTAGAHRVLTMDLHAPAIEGFFDIPVDHLQAGPLLADYVREKNLSNPVVVSPEAAAWGARTASASGLAPGWRSSPSSARSRMWPKCWRWSARSTGDGDHRGRYDLDRRHAGRGGALAQGARRGRRIRLRHPRHLRRRCDHNHGPIYACGNSCDQHYPAAA